MKISKILMLSSLLIFSNCFSQKNDLNILGTWKNTESSASNGAKMFTTKIENGNILIFKNKNIVIRNSKEIGNYKIIFDTKLNDNILKLSFGKQEEYYLIIKSNNKSNEIYLSPVADQYQIICDEGCSLTYEKL